MSRRSGTQIPYAERPEITLDQNASIPLYKQLEASFVRWVQGISRTVKGVVAIDGKTLRRSHDRAAGKKALHLMSAWAVENRLILAQLATEEKSNEITAIPLLLQQLVLKGCIVTIDAMGTQRKIAEQIIEQEGDYALALKDNQGNLYEEVKATFALAEKEGFAHVQAESHRQVEKGHGRLEIREYWTIRDKAILEHLDSQQQWKGWQAFGMVRAERHIEGEVSRETRYFLLSFSSAQTFAYAVRSHWGIEIVFIGCWMWRFGKMIAVYDSVMPTKIWPSYATSV